MAGGQERVLRRRIKSVQSTKKITKAMELIAASRIVKAQQRVAAARPYSEQITEVIRNLAAAGAGVRLAAAAASASEVDTVCLRGRRRRPRPGRRLQHHRSSAPPSGPSMADQAEGRHDRAGHRRQEGHRLLPVPGLRHRRQLRRLLRRPHLRGRPRDRRAVVERFEAGEYDEVELVLHPVPLGRRAARRRASSASCPSTRDVLDDGRAAGDDGPTADYEFEPSPDEILDRLLPRYAEARLYAALLDAAASSTPPGSGP